MIFDDINVLLKGIQIYKNEVCLKFNKKINATRAPSLERALQHYNSSTELCLTACLYIILIQQRATPCLC